MKLKCFTLHNVLASLTIVGVLAMAVRTPVDTDLYWQLRYGEWQVQNRSILLTDMFSHTRTGAEWIYPSWLAQVILYELYAWLGNFGLAAYVALLAAVGVSFIWLSSDGDVLVKSGTVFLGAAAAAVFWSPRPQMFTFALASIALFLIKMFVSRGGQQIWLFLPLVALWSNLHAGVFSVYILLFLVITGEAAKYTFERWLRKEKSADEDIPIFRPTLILAGVMLASLPFTLLTPYGFKLWEVPFNTVGVGVLRDFIAEWNSPDFHWPPTWPFLALLFLTYTFSSLRKEGLGWRDAFLLTGTGLMSLWAGRNISLFVIPAVPVLCESLSEWLSDYGYKGNWHSVPPPRLAVLNGSMILLAIFGLVGKFGIALDPDTVNKAEDAILPVHAVEVLNAEAPPGNLFNSYNWGGYLVWEARNFPVYVDGRTDLYGDLVLDQYVAIRTLDPAWEEMLKNDKVNTVLIETDSPLAHALEDSPNWKILHRDHTAILLVRKSTP